MAVIKAATQAKRRAGVDAGAMVFDGASSKPIPSGKQYQPFIRVPGNRDRIASHLWQRTTNHPDGKWRHTQATFMAFGVAPVATAESTGEERRVDTPPVNPLSSGTISTPGGAGRGAGGGDAAGAPSRPNLEEPAPLPGTGSLPPGSAPGGGGL